MSAPERISARKRLHSFFTHTALKYSGLVPSTTMTFALFSAAKMYGSYCWPSLSSRVMRLKNTLKPSRVSWWYRSLASTLSGVRLPSSSVSL